MSGMATSLSWTDIAVRLLLTILAAVVIGYDRSEHGKAAGMRTTLLVCLAASASMIQVNLLLPTAGRAADSFVMNDLMRLPLGILTGVGFIGGGAILRRENIVVGVTTAATLWLMTVIGLCFGGGQLGLGLVATGIGMFALQGLRWIENRLTHECRARLSILVDDKGPSEGELRQRLEAAGLMIAGSCAIIDRGGARREFVLDIQQMRSPPRTETPAVVTALAAQSGVLKLQWDGR
jgi:putative Mg2+ transporter-C (MgtC) family protein